MHGFMDGYTWWIIEDDDEDVHMAENNDMGVEEEMPDDGGLGEEGAGHGDEEEAVHYGEEGAVHGGEEAGHGGEEVDTQQSSTRQSSIMQDSHV